MDLQTRIALLVDLGEYLKNNDLHWQQAKLEAEQANGWFSAEFIQHAADNICTNFLEKEALEKWVSHYHLDNHIQSKNVGVVMAGNIPMVGFHDMLAVFISGHNQTIKPSSKDAVLIQHLVAWMATKNEAIHQKIKFADMLKGCDAYIATGSNHSGKYFEQYFGKYPHIIRKNKTSVAILDGSETVAQLQALADDVNLYFGLGCRNVTHIFVPTDYNFESLLKHFEKYLYFSEHHKYKNNYDYQLSLLLLNNRYYMTNGSVLLSENAGLFSPISHLYYSFYKVGDNPIEEDQNASLQCVIGNNHIPLGKAQSPGLFDYADGVDSMAFLLTL